MEGKDNEKCKRYLKLYIQFQIQNIHSMAQYRADFLMMIFFTVFAQACNLGVVTIIYSNIPQVGGWSLWEILLLYGFLLFSEGCINFFFQGAWKISEMINKSDLDRFLVRPVPVGLQLLTARIDFDGLNKMVIAAAVLGLGISRCEIQWSISKVILFVCFLAEACAVRVCMIWIASCLSFWMEGGKNSLNFFTISLGEMAKYPLVIYPPLLQGIFGYLNPYAFVSYYPVGYLLGKGQMTLGVICMPLVCAVMISVSVLVLRRGLNRYESSVNAP